MEQRRDGWGTRHSAEQIETYNSATEAHDGRSTTDRRFIFEKKLKGTLKTFGSSGPMYEVLGPAERSVQGKEAVTIRVFGTGEVTAYPVEEMLQDPEAV